MITSLIASCILGVGQSGTAVSLRPGYYSLEEIGNSMRVDGLSIHVDASCSKDVYAACINDATVSELSAALEADGRILVSRQGNDWTIGRNPTWQRESQEAVDWYLDALGSAIDRAHGAAMRVCARWDELGGDGVSALITSERMRSDLTPNEKHMYDILYRTVVSNDTRFRIISLPAEASGKGFCKATERFATYSLWERPDLFAASGRIEDVHILGVIPGTSADIESRARSISVAGLLQWDPLSNDIGLRDYMEIVVGGRTIGSGVGTWEVSPRWLNVTFPSVRPNLLADVDDDRYVASDDQLPAWMSANAEYSSKTVPLSEILLRSVDRDQGSFLAYLPTTGDYVLTGGQPWSAVSAIEAANAWRVDSDWIATVRQERSGVRRQERNQLLLLDPEVGLTLSGDVVVAQYRRSFMDTLATFPQTQRLKLLDQSFEKDVTVASILSTVSDIEWKGVVGSLYPMDMIQFCNPNSLFPIAVAYRDSRSFRSFVDEALLAGDGEQSFDVQGRTFWSVLKSAMSECAGRSMRIERPKSGEYIDPKVSVGIIERLNLPVKLNIEINGALVSFEMRSEESVYWSTWINLLAS